MASLAITNTESTFLLGLYVNDIDFSKTLSLHSLRMLGSPDLHCVALF